MHRERMRKWYILRRMLVESRLVLAKIVQVCCCSKTGSAFSEFAHDNGKNRMRRRFRCIVRGLEEECALPGKNMFARAFGLRAASTHSLKITSAETPSRTWRMFIKCPETFPTTQLYIGVVSLM
jgi:hypothetical protein